MQIVDVENKLSFISDTILYWAIVVILLIAPLYQLSQGYFMAESGKTYTILDSFMRVDISESEYSINEETDKPQRFFNHKEYSYLEYWPIESSISLGLFITLCIYSFIHGYLFYINHSYFSSFSISLYPLLLLIFSGPYSRIVVGGLSLLNRLVAPLGISLIRPEIIGVYPQHHPGFSLIFLVVISLVFFEYMRKKRLSFPKKGVFSVFISSMTLFASVYILGMVSWISSMGSVNEQKFVQWLFMNPSFLMIIVNLIVAGYFLYKRKHLKVVFLSSWVIIYGAITMMINMLLTKLHVVDYHDSTVFLLPFTLSFSLYLWLKVVGVSLLQIKDKVTLYLKHLFSLFEVYISN